MAQSSWATTTQGSSSPLHCRSASGEMPSAKGKARPVRTSLAELIRARLRPVEARKRKARLVELRAAARQAAVDVGDGLDDLLDRPELAAFVGSLLEVSPFLRTLIFADPAGFLKLLRTDPAKRLRTIISGTEKSWRNADEASLMMALRSARKEIALLVGIADLGGVF